MIALERHRIAVNPSGVLVRASGDVGSPAGERAATIGLVLIAGVVLVGGIALGRANDRAYQQWRQAHGD